MLSESLFVKIDPYLSRIPKYFFAMPPKLYFVTTNRRKFEEYAHILVDFDLERLEPVSPEIQGDALSVLRHKAKSAADYFKVPIIVDDVSLTFEAWHHLPGVYINDFIQNLEIEQIYHLLDGFNNKKAYALALIGYCKPKHDPIVFTGKVAGKIVLPRGPLHFGWDPIFEPLGYKQTFAEMGLVNKNKISHRGLALKKLQKFLQEKS
jgi:inosine triphosphate pyrophosphatase